MAKPVAQDAGDQASDTAMGGKRPSYPIESVDNALRLLLLVEQEESLRVSQAAAHLGVAVSTAHRLLAMLQYYGLVQQDVGTKAYVAGPVLVRIGMASLRGMDLRANIRPHLEALSRELDETVHLVIRQAQLVLFIDSVESRKAMRVVSRVGASLPAHCTSAGKALLAGLSEDQLLALYPAEDLPALTGHSLSTRSALIAELKTVRRNGFSSSREESEDGVGSIGMVIRDRRGSDVAALSVAMPLSRLPHDGSLHDIALKVRDSVAEMTGALP